MNPDLNSDITKICFLGACDDNLSEKYLLAYLPFLFFSDSVHVWSESTNEQWWYANGMGIGPGESEFGYVQSPFPVSM